MSQDLTAGIRRTATPPRSAGHQVAKTIGVNTGEPTLQRESSQDFSYTAKGFPSIAGAGHKDNTWHELTNVEHRAFTETSLALTLAAGQTLKLDPTRVQIYYVDITGPATIDVGPVAFPEPEVPRQDAPERRRTYSSVLRLSIPSGGSFPTIIGAVWSEGRAGPNLTLPDGTEPEDFGGRYTFTFLFDPVIGDILGHEGGLRF